MENCKSSKMCLLLFLFMTLKGSAFAQPPVISIFTPLTAPVGATVTINGNNFNTTPSNNIVYFGAVRATVLTATSNLLTVKVPSGASNQPITITNAMNGLTGYSSKWFLATFLGGDNAITANSFDNVQSVSTGVSPNSVAIGDMDSDGRPDMAAICDPGGSGFTISLLRNTTTSGNISFAAKIDTVFSGFSGHTIVLADMDGDGLPDLLSGSTMHLYVWRNTSTPGNIDFSDVLAIDNGIASGISIRVNDMDSDGKPDIVFVNGGNISLLKNNSIKGKMAFGAVQTIQPEGLWNATRFLNVGDLDGDAKPDIAAIAGMIDNSGRSIDSFLILKNTSIGGIISFSTKRYYLVPDASPTKICMGDMNGDGTLDITFANPGNESVNIFTNSSTPGNISLASSSGKGGMYFTTEVANGDLNGDGKPDLLVNRPSFYRIAVIQNNSKPCSGGLGPLVEFEEPLEGLVIADLNGDGKPELIGARNGANAIKIFRNRIDQRITACANSSMTISSSHTGIFYQWQQSTGNAYVNINDNGTFAGTNSPALQINNIFTAWNGYRYRCIVDADTSNAFSLVVASSIVPDVTINYCPTQVCQGNNRVLLTAASLNSGPSPLYQWQDSTDIAGWKNITNATAEMLEYTITNMCKIRCILTSTYSCAVPAIDTSNIIITSVIPVVTPAITITGNTTIEPRRSTTLTATSVNGGTVPLYQWQDSTDEATWTNIPNAIFATLQYSPAKTGNKVRCVLKSTIPCATPATSTSNVLTFTINVPTAVSNIPGTGHNIVIFPNPASHFLYIDSLKLTDGWQWLQIIGSDGRNAGLSLSLKGLSRSQIDISRLPRGQYFIILQRKEGERFYYKFIRE